MRQQRRRRRRPQPAPPRPRRCRSATSGSDDDLPGCGGADSWGVGAAGSRRAAPPRPLPRNASLLVILLLTLLTALPNGVEPFDVGSSSAVGCLATKVASTSASRYLLHRFSGGNPLSRRSRPTAPSTTTTTTVGWPSSTRTAAAVLALRNDDGKEERTDDASLLTDEELLQVRGLFLDDDGDETLQKKVRDALLTLSPSLLVKLQRHLDSSPSTNSGGALDDENFRLVQRAARAVQAAVEERRSEGADLLKQLLGAGEIRTLDSLIGRAARNGRLDPAFFQVLQLNLRDAQLREQKNDETSGAGGGADADAAAAAASRYQVLSHIYTRCQEEVEKSLPPGIALLNKLMRTPEPAIRSNLISHYLTPPASTITSPDGKTLTLSNASANPLVSIDDLIGAVTTLVSQVRMVEAQQQQPLGSAAIMVESVRQLCKEVLGILMESYGLQSTQAERLKEGLQPVFRPEIDSPHSATSSPSTLATEA